MKTSRISIRKLLAVIFVNILLLEVLLFVARIRINPDHDLEMQTYGDPLLVHRKSPHPYLGFISKDFAPIDIDALPDRDTKFVLTIAGGSVAQEMCRINKTEKVIQRILEEKLKKQVVLNCIAVESYMQPQQTISALLYARGSDFFISLEGVNELFDTKDKDEPSYPQAQFKRLFFSDFRGDFWRKNVVYILSLVEMWAYDRRSVLDYSNSITFFKSILRRAIANYTERLLSVEIDSVTLDVRLQIWKRSLEDMQDLMSARKTPYLIVLQPQVFDKKQHSTQEQQTLKQWGKTLINMRNDFFVRSRTMLNGIDQLHWSDWTQDFDFLNNVEFRDDCHFTDATSAAFSRKTAEEVLNHLDKVISI